MGELSYASPQALAPERLRKALPLAGGALAVGALGASGGGYFASSWGWAIVVAVATLAWALSAGAAFRPTRAEALFMTGLMCLAGWYGLSSAWGRPSQAVDETARVLVYVAVVAAAWAVTRRAGAASLAAGTLVGTAGVAAYALATRLFPDRIGTFDSINAYRLATPIGYWNGLGLLCAIGVLAALSFVATTESPRRAALAAMPVPVLGATIYFTFSRGAWISLGIGFAVAMAVASSRVRLTGAALAVGSPTVLGVILGSHSAALTHQQATLARATHDGHRLALVIVALAVVAGTLGAVASRMPSVRPVELVWTTVLVLGVLAAVTAALVHYGGPSVLARRGWHAFNTRQPKHQVDLQKRLFTLSGSGRVDLWRASLHEFEAHPVIGGGAGSYEQYWLQHRTRPLKVRDAHSLYLETLAELGVVGLALLLVALGVPLVVGLRHRNVLTGAYAAYLAGAGVDWDWEITAVTTAALLVAVAVVAAARSDESARRSLSPGARYAILAAAVCVAPFGLVFLVGNMFLSRSMSAASSGHWVAAATDAKRASQWLPWSTDPQRQLGEAQLALGDTAAAQRTFRSAIAKDGADWNLWLDLARATAGTEQAAALARATKLDPLAPEVKEFKTEVVDQPSITVGGSNG